MSIGTSSHTLSYLFNQYLNRNYYDYINDYRIAEFKRLVEKDEYAKYTFECIWLSCVGSVQELLSFDNFKKRLISLPMSTFEVLGKTMNNLSTFLLRVSNYYMILSVSNS